MKKNILIMFAAAGLLTGCSLSDIFPFSKNDEGSADNTQQIENIIEPIVEADDEIKDDPVPTGVTTKTINFFGNALPNEWTAPGVSMDSTLLSCETQNDRLVNITKNQINDNNLISELFFTKLNTAYFDSSSLIIQIGTGNPTKNNFNPGTFIWTSVSKIIKIDVTAMCYVKEQGATDSSAHLKIEAGTKGVDKNYNRPITNSTTSDMSFAVQEDETPEYKTYSNEFAEGIDRFCLTSLDGRVFLKSLTITWWN